MRPSLEEKPGLLESKAYLSPHSACSLLPSTPRHQRPHTFGLAEGEQGKCSYLPGKTSSCLSLSTAYFPASKALDLADPPFSTELTTHMLVS